LTLVIDASVVLRSLVPSPEGEQGSERATAFLSHVAEQGIRVLQPAHWLADLGQALLDISPRTASRDLTLLAALEWPESREPGALVLACELAIRLRRPLRETLYHAVALEAEDGVLITADASYRRAARGIARVLSIEEWHAGDMAPERSRGGRSGQRVTARRMTPSGG
jgi:hypothetical protein